VKGPEGFFANFPFGSHEYTINIVYSMRYAHVHTCVGVFWN